MKTRITPFILLILCLSLTCSRLPVRSYTEIEDLRAIPQDVSTVINNLPVYHGTSKNIKALRRAFIKSFFAPWLWKKLHFKRKTINRLWFDSKVCYGSNFLTLPAAWFKKLYYNASYKDYRTLNKAGIITNDTNLRVMPTIRPCFFNPDKAGEGYPFDYFQADRLYTGTPVRISHYSRDKAWVFVITGRLMFGWVPVKDIAFVSSENLEKYMSYPLAVMRLEKRPLYEYLPKRNEKNEAGGYVKSFLSYSNIGMILPLTKMKKNYLVCMFPKRNSHGNLSLSEIRISTRIAASHPLPLLKNEAGTLLKELLGTKYSWSSAYDGRDCSALTRDFAAAFGIYLTRTVRSQTKNGRKQSLKNMSNIEKLKIIKKKAVPFATLISTGNHIMIYVGEYKKQPLVFHNKWGIVTSRGEQRGRNIVGKTVLTTLQPGKELSNFSEKSSILNMASALIFLNLPVQKK